MHLHINYSHGFAFIVPQWCREDKFFLMYLMCPTLLFSVYSWSSGMNYQLLMGMENNRTEESQRNDLQKKRSYIPQKKSP